MKLKIANYTCESIDNLNIKVSKEVFEKGKVTNQFMGYYGNLRDCVLKIIKDRTLNSEFEGSLNDFLRVYDNINKTTLAEVKNAMVGLQ